MLIRHNQLKHIFIQIEFITESLDYWINQKRRGIWFRVHKEESAWVPILIEVIV